MSDPIEQLAPSPEFNARAKALMQKQQLRVDLIAKLPHAFGATRQQIQARLATLNVEIKRDNVIVNEAYHARSLFLAIRKTLPPETADKVLEAARWLRVECEMQS